MKPPFESLPNSRLQTFGSVVLLVNFWMVFLEPLWPWLWSSTTSERRSQSQCLERTNIESQTKSEQNENRKGGQVFGHFENNGMYELLVRRLGQAAPKRHRVHGIVNAVEKGRTLQAVP